MPCSKESIFDIHSRNENVALRSLTSKANDFFKLKKVKISARASMQLYSDKSLISPRVLSTI